MKFCQVVLLMTLGMTGDMVMGAQTLPTDTVLVASEALPEGGLFLPDLLAGSGHDALLQGMALTPEISQAAVKPPAAPEPAPKLTRQDRLTLFWNDTYASPGAFAGLSVGAFIDQVRHTPAKWDGDGSSYTRRFASEYGQLAARNVIHEGLDSVTGLDPRYTPCKCDGTLHRSAHALKMTFTTYRQDGRLILDMPQIASAYGSGMISTYWYPHHQYTPLVQGVQFGHEQMGEVLIGNLVQEFGPDLKRSLHLHALVARRISRPSDDD
ncbi:MAG TPA: hypothetical protein VFE27_15385 [Acidobacteriaceae bacterium]|nr:hypothetical protein [Acidobacteriaceae bacterium]